MKKKMKELLINGSIILFVIFLLAPLYFAILAASHEGVTLMQSDISLLPGKLLWSNLKTVLTQKLTLTGGQSVWEMLVNSFCMAMVIALGKVILAVLSAFAFVYFEFPLKRCFFLIILLTLMLPVEVRIMPTFQIVALFSWINTFSGLSVPLMASASSMLLLRQTFKTLPPELVEASKLDGAGPWRFFLDILLPLSKSQIAALFVVLFIYGWNQYLWPLIVTTDSNMTTIVMGIRYLAGVSDQVPQWHFIMTIALIALFPPCLLILAIQRWFERGLIY